MTGGSGDSSGRHVYSGEDIAVSFDADRCLHYAECVRGLPAVFDTQRRPWITPDADSADRVAEVVERCPTGALRYARTAGPDELGPAITDVRRTPEGRIEMRGRFSVVVEQPDHSIQRSDETRLVACGCSRSTLGFLCDGTCTTSPDA